MSLQLKNNIKGKWICRLRWRLILIKKIFILVSKIFILTMTWRNFISSRDTILFSQKQANRYILGMEMNKSLLHILHLWVLLFQKYKVYSGTMKGMLGITLIEWDGWRQRTFNVLFLRKAISSIFAWLILEMVYNI